MHKRGVHLCEYVRRVALHVIMKMKSYKYEMYIHIHKHIYIYICIYTVYIYIYPPAFWGRQACEVLLLLFPLLLSSPWALETPVEHFPPLSHIWFIWAIWFYHQPGFPSKRTRTKNLNLQSPSLTSLASK